MNRYVFKHKKRDVVQYVIVLAVISIILAFAYPKIKDKMGAATKSTTSNIDIAISNVDANSTPPPPPGTPQTISLSEASSITFYMLSNTGTLKSYSYNLTGSSALGIVYSGIWSYNITSESDGYEFYFSKINNQTVRMYYNYYDDNDGTFLNYGYIVGAKITGVTGYQQTQVWATKIVGSSNLDPSTLNNVLGSNLNDSTVSINRYSDSYIDLQFESIKN